MSMRVWWGVFAMVAALTTPAVNADSKDALRSTSLPVLSPPHSPPFLNLRLTVSEELPFVSRLVLTQEADAIWRSGHVRLRWLKGKSPAPDAGPALRVLVAQRPVAGVTHGDRWAVGELLRFEGTHAIAVASITGAQRVVAASQRFRLLDIPLVEEQRLGVVLGRAVAHEIGHFLLHTNTHAADGLMRANIDASEFADLRVESFRLDRAAEAHLLSIAAQGPGWLERARAGSFSY